MTLADEHLRTAHIKAEDQSGTTWYEGEVMSYLRVIVEYAIEDHLDEMSEDIDPHRYEFVPLLAAKRAQKIYT